jgi:hypothetical protein
MEIISQMIGPILSSIGLVWGMYTFFIKRKDEQAKKERDEFSALIEFASNRSEKDLSLVKEKLSDMKQDMDKLKSAMGTNIQKLDAQSNLFLAQAKVFDEAQKRVEKTLDRHEEKLDAFGLVRVK